MSAMASSQALIEAREINDRWASLYEQAAERAEKAEQKVRALEKELSQMEERMNDWKQRAQERSAEKGVVGAYTA